MKTKIGSILMIATFVLSMTAVAQTPQNRQDRQDRKAMMKREFRADADRKPFFTEEQREAVKAIRLETAEEVKTLRNQLRELNARHQTLTTAVEADLDAIYENIEKMSEVKTEMAKIRAQQHQEVRGLLTKEQLMIFDNHKGMMQKKGHGSFKNGKRNEFRNFERPGRS